MVKLAQLLFLLCVASVSAFTLELPSTRCRCSSRPSVTAVDRQTTTLLQMAEPPAEDDAVPEGLQALLETPEIMELLQSPKMQEAMQLVMAGKQEELQERVKEDAEFQEIVEKLNEILGGAQ